MTKQPATHATAIELAEPPPSEVPVGAAITLRLKVACAAGCDLHGVPLAVTTADGAAITGEACDAEADETSEVTFRAPLRPGDHALSIVLPPHEHDGIVHEASALPVQVKVIPHGTSLAVWSIPSFVVTGEAFTIKVGAKSSADCALQGESIEVCDHTGAVVARGTLGDTPWPGTSALYWTDVELPAPTQEGVSAWSVRFEVAALELAHDGAASGFSFVVVRPPEHTLTVKVREKETAAPIDNVQIRVGAYRGATDETGRADVKISKGSYDLHIWKVGYEAPPQTIAVDADAVVEVEVLTVPEDDPDAVWLK
jgi:hypothetical protein